MARIRPQIATALWQGTMMLECPTRIYEFSTKTCHREMLESAVIALARVRQIVKEEYTEQQGQGPRHSVICTTISYDNETNEEEAEQFDTMKKLDTDGRRMSSGAFEKEYSAATEDERRKMDRENARLVAGIDYNLKVEAVQLTSGPANNSAMGSTTSKEVIVAAAPPLDIQHTQPTRSQTSPATLSTESVPYFDTMSKKNIFGSYRLQEVRFIDVEMQLVRGPGNVHYQVIGMRPLPKRILSQSDTTTKQDESGALMHEASAHEEEQIELQLAQLDLKQKELEVEKMKLKIEQKQLQESKAKMGQWREQCREKDTRDRLSAKRPRSLAKDDLDG